MILQTILAVLLTRSATIPLQQPPLKASTVMSKMLAHYFGAQTMVGNVLLTVVADQGATKLSQTIKTHVEFERPSKVLLQQDRSEPQAQSWTVTSDGSAFSYEPPSDIIVNGSKRLVERCVSPAGVGLDVSQIYAISSINLGDRSAPLGIAFSWKEELKRIVGRWATMQLGRDTVLWQGQPSYLVTGSFREEENEPISGTFRMLIDTKDYSLKRYQVEQLLSGPAGTTIAGITKVTMTWDVDFQVNAKPDEKAFRVKI